MNTIQDKHSKKEKKPDFIVCLGDLLHNHERLNTMTLNKAYDFIHKMRNIAAIDLRDDRRIAVIKCVPSQIVFSPCLQFFSSQPFRPFFLFSLLLF